MRACLFLVLVGLFGAAGAAGPTLIKDKDPVPDFTGVKLVFCAVASYNPAGDGQNKGYLQSFPWYVEKLIRDNQALLPQMRILLIDPCWHPTKGCGDLAGVGGYGNSDLKRYLTLPNGLGKKNLGEKSLGEKIEDQIYLVGREFSQSDLLPGQLELQLAGVLQGGGIVFLITYARRYTDGLFPPMYNKLWNIAPMKENIQYLEDYEMPPMNDCAQAIWPGVHQDNCTLFAIFHKRLDFFTEQVGNLQPGDLKQAFLKSLETDLSGPVASLANKGSVPGNECKYKVLLDLLDGKTVLDISGNQVLLTREFFATAPLPYMLVSNDPNQKQFPLLEYDLDVTTPNKWKLVHKFSWKTNQLKHLGVPGDPLGDALKKFSASLGALETKLKGV